MRFLNICLLLCLLFGACATPDQQPAQTTADLSRAGVDEFIDGYFLWRPQTASALGLHEYDGHVGDYSSLSIQAEIARLHRFQQRFGAMLRQSLTAAERFDLRLLQGVIRTELFALEDMRAYHVNPMSYINPFDLSLYIKRDFAPLEERVKSIIKIEREAKSIFAAARHNLEWSLPKPYIETAIESAEGSAEFLEKDMVAALKNLTNASLKAEFEEANAEAVAEIRSFVAYLKSEKLPSSHENYALGLKKYQRMLAAEMIGLSPARLLELGLEELKREQAVFAEAARVIDPSRPAIEVFKAIQKEHPTAGTLLSDVRKNLETIRNFVVTKQIVTIPSEERAKVDETPQFARATSFASMDTPGAFETKSREAYYYVTPVEPEWPDKQKEEWLTAFNYYTTDIVSIHEAYPGHYVQFLSLNASNASRVQKMFPSYSFAEGWAHYAEKMMLDEGFGGPDKVTAAKYRLAQSDEALLRLCRLCVSIKTHCEGMSLTNATKFFEENCYYEPKPAFQEALRGTFDPQYLYYTLGKLQLLKLRESYQKQEGENFSLKKFHDAVLSHGAPPIRLLREVLLKDPASAESF